MFSVVESGWRSSFLSPTWKCKWSTDAKAPLLLKPIQSSLAWGIMGFTVVSNSEKTSSRIEALGIYCGIRSSRRGMKRQWERKSGLMLTFKIEWQHLLLPYRSVFCSSVKLLNMEWGSLVACLLSKWVIVVKEGQTTRLISSGTLLKLKGAEVLLSGGLGKSTAVVLIVDFRLFFAYSGL